MPLNEKDLVARGFVLQPDGSYAKRPVPVGAVENPQRKPDQRSQSEDRVVGSLQKGVAHHIVIISVRHRTIDAHDNLRTGAKPLVDRITESLGYRDDSDPALKWEYEQIKSPKDGPEGTIVLMTVL